VGTLYVVEMLPLESHSITLRARRILEQASMIVALPRDIHTARNRLKGCGLEAESITPYDPETVLAVLQAGDVVLLADTSSGLDALDQLLVDRSISVVPIPGAVDLVTALTLSGLATDRFTYLGPLPTSLPDLIAVWQDVATESSTLVCRTQGTDLNEPLDTLTAVLGQRRIALFQAGAIWRGSTNHLPRTPVTASEPVILIVEGADKQTEIWPEDRVRTEIRAHLERGTSPRDIAATIAVRAGWKKRQVYALTTEIKNRSHLDAAED
jgi:16S rRNA C1402 (ribose-2'-O) methylase RsmI